GNYWRHLTVPARADAVGHRAVSLSRACGYLRSSLRGTAELVAVRASSQRNGMAPPPVRTRSVCHRSVMVGGFSIVPPRRDETCSGLARMSPWGQERRLAGFRDTSGLAQGPDLADADRLYPSVQHGRNDRVETKCRRY